MALVRHIDIRSGIVQCILHLAAMYAQMHKNSVLLCVR